MRESATVTTPTVGTAPPGVCGPDVTAEVEAIWTQIQTDFRAWSPSQRDSACTQVLIPFKMPTRSKGDDLMTFARSAADINGWDVLPLFQLQSQWLRSWPIYDAATGGPCATPSSPNPAAGPGDDAHESDQTCSNTVQVSGQCWLNGTVNYGTYGIMIRLCRDEFPLKFRLALQMAENLIRAYKSIGAHPEDATLPLAWLRATYNGGPSGRPSNPGNRPQCKCSCACKGSVTNWDYVWEPVKPRSKAAAPKIPVKPAAAAVPPPVTSAAKTHVVVAGESLSLLAKKYYGDATQWPKIHQANKAAVGPNPNLLKAGTKLTIP
jgi:LysM domain